MSVYSSYSSSPSLPIWPIFLMGLVAALLALSTLGGAATVQIATPKQTPDPNRVGGIDINKAVEEAKSVIKDLVPGGDPTYLRSTGSLLRVYSGWDGQVFIIGHDNAPSLLAAAEKIAAAIGAIVAP